MCNHFGPHSKTPSKSGLRLSFCSFSLLPQCSFAVVWSSRFAVTYLCWKHVFHLNAPFLKCLILKIASVPVVQMALQTESNYFWINYAFYSRYRYRWENCFEINVSLQKYRYSYSLQFWGGHLADKNSFGKNFDFIADTDTEKYYLKCAYYVRCKDKRFYKVRL